MSDLRIVCRRFKRGYAVRSVRISDWALPAGGFFATVSGNSGGMARKIWLDYLYVDLGDSSEQI